MTAVVFQMSSIILYVSILSKYKAGAVSVTVSVPVTVSVTVTVGS